MTTTLEEVLRQGEEEALHGLIRFLAWPSVSTDPASAGAVRDCAAWLADELGRAGLENTRI